MSRIVRSIEIEAAPARVWEVLADFGGIARWNPNVSKSHSTSAANGGVGATRHCDLKGGAVEERVVGWQEGRSLTLEIYDAKGSPSMLARATATFEVGAAAGGAVVTATMDYELKGRALGKLMDLVVARRQFARSFEQLLAGLRHHLATGEEVDYGRSLDFRAGVAA